MNAVIQGGKRGREGMGRKATLNQGKPPHSLTLVMYAKAPQCNQLYILKLSILQNKLSFVSPHELQLVLLKHKKSHLSIYRFILSNMFRSI